MNPYCDGFEIGRFAVVAILTLLKRISSFRGPETGSSCGR